MIASYPYWTETVALIGALILQTVAISLGGVAGIFERDKGNGAEEAITLCLGTALIYSIVALALVAVLV